MGYIERGEGRGVCGENDQRASMPMHGGEREKNVKLKIDLVIYSSNLRSLHLLIVCRHRAHGSCHICLRLSECGSASVLSEESSRRAGDDIEDEDEDEDGADRVVGKERVSHLVRWIFGGREEEEACWWVCASRRSIWSRIIIMREGGAK